MRAVTNAGPLIHLSWIGRLDLLQELFEQTVAPAAVREEVLRAAPGTPGVEAIRAAFAAGRLEVRSVRDVAAVADLATGLDRGESEAIVLTGEVGADILLMDERRGRASAARRGLSVTGTIGILRRAKDHGHIEAVTPLLEELRRRGFRISVELMEQVRREEGARGQG